MTLLGTLALSFTTEAGAAIRVEHAPTTGCDACFVDVTASVSIVGSDVIIDQPQDGVYRIYSTTPLFESLGTLSFTNASGALVSLLLLAPPASDFTAEQPPPGAIAFNSWMGGLNPGAASVTAQMSIVGNVEGVIMVDNLHRLDTPGDIDADIVTQGVITGMTCDNFGGAINPTPGETLDLLAIQASGVIGGTITARDIGLIFADGGLGSIDSSSGDPMCDPRAVIHAQRSIGSITAPRMCATITTDTTVASLESGIGFIDIFDGSATGSITAARLGLGAAPSGAIFISDDADHLTIDLTDGLPPASSIVVGGGWTSAAPSSLSPQLLVLGSGAFQGSPTHRLAGQVVFDDRNLGALADGWFYVFNDPYNPEAPYRRFIVKSDGAYNNDFTAADLGGGVVGTLPFRFSGADSWPPPGDDLTLTEAPQPGVPVRLFHTGPVGWNAGAGVPVRIHRTAFGSGVWVDITDCVDVHFDPGLERLVLLTPEHQFANGYDYRFLVDTIDVAAAGLECLSGFAGGLAPEGHGDTYEIDIGNACPWDLDHDGITGFDDLNVMLDAWGATCFPPGDIDNDGVVEFDDLNALLGQWGLACGQTRAGESMIASAPGALVASGLSTHVCPALPPMGFETNEAFTATLEAADQAAADDLIQLLKAHVILHLAAENTP